jgi:hypothetical protein
MLLEKGGKGCYGFLVGLEDGLGCEELGFYILEKLVVFADMDKLGIEIRRIFRFRF